MLGISSNLTWVNTLKITKVYLYYYYTFDTANADIDKVSKNITSKNFNKKLHES